MTFKTKVFIHVIGVFFFTQLIWLTPTFHVNTDCQRTAHLIIGCPENHQFKPSFKTDLNWLLNTNYTTSMEGGKENMQQVNFLYIPWWLFILVDFSKSHLSKYCSNAFFFKENRKQSRIVLVNLKVEIY